MTVGASASSLCIRTVPDRLRALMAGLAVAGTLVACTPVVPSPAPHPTDLPVVTSGRGGATAEPVAAGEGTRLGDYLSEIAVRLAKGRVGAPRRVRVDDRHRPGLATGADGSVIIAHGLLALVNDEDELAGAVAHQMAHRILGHDAVASTGDSRWSSAVAPAALELDHPALAPPLRSLARRLGSAPVWGRAYDRSAEDAADRLGAILAARGGYRVDGWARCLEALARHGDAARSFVRRHPSGRGRAAAVRALGRGVPTRTVARIAAPATFLLRLDGLALGPGTTHAGNRFRHPELGFGLDLPDQWRVDHTARGMVAEAPDGRSAVVLGRVAEASDPTAIARSILASSAPASKVRATRLRGMDAARATVGTPAGGVLDLWWIAAGSAMYQAATVLPAQASTVLRAAVHQIPDSFVAADTGAATGSTVRLRIMRARAGERAEGLARRMGSVWSGAQVAHWNGIAPQSRLRDGQLMKIAVREPGWAAR